jgi:hypothetical protein
MDYEIDFGDGFAQYEWETEAKGWFDGRVKVGGSEVTISFYDPIRLAQEVQDALDQAGLFFEKNVVVIPKVNRENMEKAVEAVCTRIKPTA